MRLQPIFLAFGLTLLAATTHAETYEVKMLNGNERSTMFYEPDYLVIKPGDTVKFIAAVKGHNATTNDGFIPARAEPFKGKINQEIEVTLTAPGLYGIKCSPHYDMRMVMLIQVGKVPIDETAVPKDLPKGAAKRFLEIIERAKSQK